MFEPVETATDTQILPTDKGFYGLIISNVLAESCKYIRHLVSSLFFPTVHLVHLGEKPV